jgi:N-acetylglutamate synthase-like GNAT family acetyltransferase
VQLVIEIKEYFSFTEIDQDLMTAISEMHAIELAGTLTSKRGTRAIRGLYKRLLLTGGSLVVAIQKGQLVGVMSFTPNHKAMASLSTLAIHPLSWIRVFSSRRVTETLKEIVDAVKVSQKLVVYENHMIYITTVFVSESQKKTGIASLLFERVNARSLDLSVPVVVDTRLTNNSAHLFYEKMGMQRIDQTRLSVIFQS